MFHRLLTWFRNLFKTHKPKAMHEFNFQPNFSFTLKVETFVEGSIVRGLKFDLDLNPESKVFGRWGKRLLGF